MFSIIKRGLNLSVSLLAFCSISRAVTPSLFAEQTRCSIRRQRVLLPRIPRRGFPQPAALRTPDQPSPGFFTRSLPRLICRVEPGAITSAASAPRTGSRSVHAAWRLWRHGFPTLHRASVICCPPLVGCEGMRLRGGRDSDPDSHLDLLPPRPPVAWLPGVLRQGVRLRLRLERRDDQGRGCWHLVDLEAEPEPHKERLGAPESNTCTQSLMSAPSVGSDMQTPTVGLQFIAGPQGKIPGRKRGRPPIRKLEFQTHYVEALSPLKVPKKRGRKPGFKLKPRMVMSPLANSPPSSTPEPELGSIPQDAAIVPHSATPQVLTAETPMPDDFLCDPPVDSKRYAVDPSDSAFNVMASQYPAKHSYSYRGSSCSTSVGVCRQASSPGSFQDGHRNGYSSMPDSGECKRPADKDPSSWGVEEVVWFIKDADPQALGPHAEAFRKHEIDGDALLLLKSEMMMKYLGLKLGPALKLCYHIDRLRQNRL